jgi:nickel transport protein
MKKITLLIASLALTTVTNAHEIWFAQRSGELALVYGHGPEDLSVIKRAKLITSVEGVDATGNPVPTSLKLTDHLAFVDTASTTVTVTATMDNGNWSKDADGKWFNKGQDEVANAKISGRYFKYATHLRTLPSGAMKPLSNLKFQIIPISSQFPKHSGNTLAIQVLLDGKPAAGASIWVDAINDPDAKPLRTNKDGKLSFKVRNQGLNVVKAELSTSPMESSKTKQTEHNATLSFVLSHKPE